jgi:hypothetical protein
MMSGNKSGLLPLTKFRLTAGAPSANGVVVKKNGGATGSDFAHAFPAARLWGPQSTIKKRRDLAFQPPLNNEPPPEWAEVFDQAWLRGSPFLDEIEFFHKPSATAIIADMSQNFSSASLRDHLALVDAASRQVGRDDRRQGLWSA